VVGKEARMELLLARPQSVDVLALDDAGLQRTEPIDRERSSRSVDVAEMRTSSFSLPAARTVSLSMCLTPRWTSAEAAAD